MLLGIIISLIFETSLDTSLPHAHLAERAYFFARKSNPLNQLFVKKSWGWTSLVYLLHLAASPPARNSRRSRLAVWILATASWLVFTTWFFGAGLGDRVIALSGGSCVVALPREWDLDPEVLQPLLPAEFPEILTATNSDQLFLPLSSAFCSLRLPLTPKTHPDLFSLLSSTSLVFPTDPVTNTLHPTSSHPALELPIPKWHRGFDISGHAFLLTLSALVLARELSPSWRRDRLDSVGRASGWGKWVHAIATWSGTIFIALWVWMLTMTAIWFHNTPEKLSGLALGLGVATLINFIIPSTSSLPILRSRTQAVLAGVTREDENAARRGQVVDEGLIIEEVDETSTSSTAKGKSKAE
ncbi:MAG: hypothetical protein TREMPRED_001545 [Tremellales sp. Tagirdzhanova-0007]|nr:MAG: hypothetical protein TREMPRED_001545 [Tremellales sp. Tagirdzhanova-0007]